MISKVGSRELFQLTGYDNRQPNWSPDGAWIVYQAITRSGWMLRAINPSSMLKTDLVRTNRLMLRHGFQDASSYKGTEAFTYKGTDATWYPDSRRVLFSNDEGHLDCIDIFTLKVTSVTTHKGYQGAPSVSPDGKKIAYEASDRDPDGGPGTWIEVIDI